MTINVVNEKTFPEQEVEKIFFKSDKPFKSYDQISIYM